MERYSGLFVMLLFVAVSMDAQKPSDFRADAERGEKEAQFNLGLCYYYGDGASVDYHEAFNWFLKSAQQGYDKAQCNVGRMYHSGLGI
jgi:TPR repeat protein